MIRLCAALAAALVSMSVPAMAADYPTPQDGEWTGKDFKFHSGEVMPELRLHYTTVGARPDNRCWCCTAPAARPPAC